MLQKSFTIRVYGLLINKKEEILIALEMVKGKFITKFPGGGLEFGEGLIDCLVREFKEELDLDIEVADHFYTTDFFVESFFNPDSQVIAVYYFVKTAKAIDHLYNTELSDDLSEGGEHFIWKPLNELNADDFTLPIDKHVMELLLKKSLFKK